MDVTVRPPERLVVIGSVLVDILLYVQRLPERGGDLLAERSVVTSGGGMNVLAGATRLGLPAAYAGRVGDGVMGQQVMADLGNLGIPLLLPPVHGEDSGFDIGLVEPDAERTFITSPGAESRLLPTDLDAIPLLPTDAIYLSGYELCYPISGASLEQWLPRLDPPLCLVFDPGPLVAEIPAVRLEGALARADIVTLSGREAGMLTGETAVAVSAALLAERVGPYSWVVVRAGEEGCWITARGLPPQHISGRPAQALDTTGAGDTHTAALVARLARGEAMPVAARIANVAASLSVERRGPATGPTAAELAGALAML